MTDYTTGELLAASASRLLEDRRVVFAGVGMPILAALVARAFHAPDLTIVLEGGIIGPELAPGQLPISTNEMRAGRHASQLTDIVDVFLGAQRGFFDYGFLGAAQVDAYGNINSSIIGDHDSPSVRLPGSGGANDIASLCNEVFVVTTHEPRRFVEKVDFITSPGNLSGTTGRRDAGLIFGGVTKVVTDLALLDFAPDTGRMRVAGLQPGATVHDVHAATGFGLEEVDEPVALDPPSPDELDVLRSLDPSGAIL